jgi:hypothetical protein
MKAELDDLQGNLEHVTKGKVKIFLDDVVVLFCMI